MQKRRRRLIGFIFLLIVGAGVLWHFDTHIPAVSLNRVAIPDSEDCLLVRLAIQASYPDFLISRNIAKTYRAPMLKCTLAGAGIELHPSKPTFNHRYHASELTVSGPIYSAPHTFALVLLGRGDSVSGTSAFCRLQRWPWGWSVLACRQGSYLA